MSSESRAVKDEWVDVSVPLYSGMVHWPDNPPARIESMLDIEHGDGAPARAILRES